MIFSSIFLFSSSFSCFLHSNAWSCVCACVRVPVNEGDSCFPFYFIRMRKINVHKLANSMCAVQSIIWTNLIYPILTIECLVSRATHTQKKAHHVNMCVRVHNLSLFLIELTRIHRNWCIHNKPCMQHRRTVDSFYGKNHFQRSEYCPYCRWWKFFFTIQ